MRKHIRRWDLAHLPAATRRLMAARVVRLYESGLTFDQAMDRVTEMLRRTA